VRANPLGNARGPYILRDYLTNSLSPNDPPLWVFCHAPMIWSPEHVSLSFIRRGQDAAQLVKGKKELAKLIVGDQVW
jgi:hypothetical protein